MIRDIIKIGNSQGIIIPRSYLEEIGSPELVDITLTKGGIFITPLVDKIKRRKPRDEDETLGLYSIMRANIESSIKKGKVRWVGEREMERTIC